MHWADKVAEKVMDKPREKVIASGISISGHIHIGHSNDVFIADAVRRSLEERGEEAKAIWYADDFDPMRRVPWPLSEEDFEEYLGVPYVEIPSPDSDHDNFVEYFQSPFLESLEDFGVDVELYSSSQVYRSGGLAEQTRVALENADKIREILNEYRSDPLPDHWLPYDAICEECGRISTTEAVDWEGDSVYYSCSGSDYVDGCGHEGEADFTEGEGKLTWRVEWPARWEMLGVDCEPFGKDHAAAGGSYETGVEIAEEIYDYEPPEPIPYEWISLEDEPMSSSKGNVFTLPEWLEVADPELLRHFIFRSKAMKAKNFDPGLPLLEHYQEYRQLEGIYFGEEEVSESREEQEERIYELAQIDDVPESYPQRIPFKLATIMVQVSEDPDYILDILERKGVIEDLEDWGEEKARERLERAKNWVEKYAPDHSLLELLDELPEQVKEELTPDQVECLSALADYISSEDYEPVEVHNRVYEIARSNDVEPVELFQAIYMALLGQKSGPRVGNFLTALEDDFLVDRFEEAADR